MKLILIIILLFSISCSHLIVEKQCAPVKDLLTDDGEEIFVCRKIMPWD